MPQILVLGFELPLTGRFEAVMHMPHPFLTVVSSEASSAAVDL